MNFDEFSQDDGECSMPILATLKCEELTTWINKPAVVLHHVCALSILETSVFGRLRSFSLGACATLALIRLSAPDLVLPINSAARTSNDDLVP